MKRSVLFTASALFLFSAVVPQTSVAGGAIYELKLGILDHDVDGLWSGHSREEGTDYNGELVFSPAWYVLGGAMRPNIGFSLNNSDDTSKVYGGAVWEYLFNNGMFFDAGLGLAYHGGDTDERNRPDKKALGSQVLFRVSFEAGFTVAEHHRISLMFDHISNAYLADPNEGLDTLGIRYGYRF